MNTINNDSSRPGATGDDMSRYGDNGRDNDATDLGAFLRMVDQNNQLPQSLSDDTTGHDNARSGASKHDLSGTDTKERDVARPDVTKPETPDWLEIDQTILELKQLGIIRTIRSIQRYCKNGKLSCQLAPTENGVRYLIKQKSIGEFVKRHNQTMPSTGFGSRSEDGERVIEQRAIPQSELAESHVVQSNRQSELILSLKDQQIDMLKSQLEITNKQLDMKDEQISAMLERDHETNVLIQNLQNLVALPSGDSNHNDPPITRPMDVQ